MANVKAFIHNSVWLNLIALFNFKDNLILTLPSFLLYVLFIIYALKNILIKKT